MKLYSSNETNKTSTHTITTSDSLTTFFASKSEPIELYGNSTQTGTPTPDNPVSIENVTGLQEITITGTDISNTYEIDLNKSKKRRTSNLYNYTNTTQVSSGITTDSDGWITATFDNSSGISPVTLYYYTENLDLEYDTDYAIFVETKNVNKTGAAYIMVTTKSAEHGQFNSNFIISSSDLVSNRTYRIKGKTKKQTQSGYNSGLATTINYYPGTTGSITFRLSVIKNLNITTDNFVYEPFEKYNYIDYNTFVADENSTLTKLLNGIDVRNTASNGKGAYTRITGLDTNANYILTYNWQNVSNGSNYVVVLDENNNILGNKQNGNEIRFNTRNNQNVTIYFFAAINTLGESRYTNINLTQFIELNKIGTYQDRIFKSKGINLANDIFSDYDSSNASYSIYPIKLEQGATYTLKATLVGEKKTSYYNYGIVKDGTDYGTFVDLQTCVNYSTGNTSTITFTTDNTYTNPKLVCYVQQSETKFNELFTNYQIQLEKGSSATEYEPYGEPSWYIKKWIGKVILNGSENWGTIGNNRYWVAFPDKRGLTTAVPCLLYSNYFKASQNAGDTLNIGEMTEGYYTTANYNVFFNYNGSNNDLAGFKTWLSTHNTTVYYVLSTPTYTKIENEELVNQFESVLNLYKGVNNITITSSNLTPQLKLEFKDGFTNNGLGIITDVLEAKVTEQINGDYYLDFRVAINNKLADDLTYNNIITCKVADGTEQFFRIKRVVKTFTDIQIYATHIFYDLIDNVLDNVAPTGKTCEEYGRWLLSHTNYWTPFTFNSDMLSWSSGRYVRKNVVESMIGNIDNSMLVKFGGEIVRNNFDIALNYSRGNDNGVILRVGKNIKQIEITTDIDNMATRIIPVGFDGLMIPEKYIDSPLINDYPQPKMAVVEFSDIKYQPLEEGVTPSEDDGTYHVLSEAEQALRDRVHALYNSGADKPSVNVKVDWLELSKTNQYSQYSDLEKVNIGDRITISILGENYKSEVIKTTYNSLTDMIESFEIGSISASIVNAVNGNTQTIQNFSPSEILSSAASNANQQLINVLGGTYGYVGGFKIFSDKLACEYYPPADFTQTDLTKLRNYLLDPVSNPLTPEEYELYDLKKDGVINASDLLFMRKLIESGITTSNPLIYSMETGSNILDGGIKITDGNGNNILQVGFAGYYYNGENITPAVYKAGNTFYLDGYAANGYLTTSSKAVHFTIPIDGVIDGTPTITNGTFLLRGINGYLQNNDQASSTITTSSSGYTFEITNTGSNFIRIKIEKSSAFTGATNNTPVAINITGLEITFS